MPYLLLCFSIILAVLKSSVYNSYAKKSQPLIHDTFNFNAITYGTAAIIAIIVMLFGDITLTLATLFCALGYAVIVFSLQTISITAMKKGSMYLTSICIMYGMIIPSLAGPIFWGEKLGALQIVGIILMVISLWFMSDKGEKSSNVSKKWIILALFAFILSGMAGLMEKIHQSTIGRDEKSMFVLVACGFMLIFSIIASLFTKKLGTSNVKAKTLTIYGAILGAVVGFYSVVNLTLSGTLDSMIYYPIANGGAMLLTVIISVFAFKEPLDKFKIVGLIAGISGIVFLSIPI